MSPTVSPRSKPLQAPQPTTESTTLHARDGKPSPASLSGARSPSSAGPFSPAISVEGRAAPLKSAISLSVKPRTLEEIRRPSIQFHAHAKTTILPAMEKKSSGSLPRRRMSSPPPPPVFQPRVSFDTFEKKERDNTSFTLIRKHKDYEYTKRSRTFLCGLDANDYSEYALEWLIDELVDDGDEVVCLRVVDKDSSVAGSTSVEEGRYKDEAEILMHHIEEKNHENKAINLILEFAVGKVERVITSMIKLYEPAILIVGTRGRSLGGFQGLLPGSISKYCLQNSPVPVIVVRPNTQRARGKRKRQKDPSRQAYRDLLDKSGPEGGHILDSLNRNSVGQEGAPASDDEAAAVAAAIGLNLSREAKGSPLIKVESANTDNAVSPDSVGVLEPDWVPEGVELARGSDGVSSESSLDSSDTDADVQSPPVLDEAADGGGVKVNTDQEENVKLA